MAWKIEVPYDNNSPYTFSDADDAASFIVTCDQYLDNYEYDYDCYNESLDSEGQISVCGHEYYPSEILKAVDEDTYMQGYDEERRYMAGESYDYVYQELDDNECNGGNVWFDGSIHCIYIEEYDEEDDDDDEGHNKDEFFDSILP